MNELVINLLKILPNEWAIFSLCLFYIGRVFFQNKDGINIGIRVIWTLSQDSETTLRMTKLTVDIPLRRKKVLKI